jgi:hypothetical protein
MRARARRIFSLTCTTDCVKSTLNLQVYIEHIRLESIRFSRVFAKSAAATFHEHGRAKRFVH